MANRSAKEASSIARERECWERGTSMSWMDSQSGLHASLARDWRESVLIYFRVAQSALARGSL